MNGTKTLDEVLTKSGIKHSFTIRPGYRHEWRLWRQDCGSSRRCCSRSGRRERIDFGSDRLEVDGGTAARSAGGDDARSERGRIRCGGGTSRRQPAASSQGSTSADGTIRIFKTIPYAAPPVGELRWQAPKPVVPWQGVKEATSFGPRCLQGQIFGDIVFEELSEDCLTLNIWTPAKAAQRSAASDGVDPRRRFPGRRRRREPPRRRAVRAQGRRARHRQLPARHLRLLCRTRS